MLGGLPRPPRTPALWAHCLCRKGTLLINNIFAIIPAILMGVSKVAKAFELIIFSRVVLGVCAGTWGPGSGSALGEGSLWPRLEAGADEVSAWLCLPLLISRHPPICIPRPLQALCLFFLIN